MIDEGMMPQADTAVHAANSGRRAAQRVCWLLGPGWRQRGGHGRALDALRRLLTLST